MKNEHLTIAYALLSFEELPADEQALVKLAKEATQTSYAPYSHFHVGAALQLEGNVRIAGSNQENAAFGAGTCAERSALFYAHSSHPEAAVEAIAIAARGTNGELTDCPISPCGICRQALLEAQNRAGKPIRVLLCGRRHIIRLTGIENLLPFAFNEIV